MERTTKLYLHPEIVYSLTKLSKVEQKIQNNMNNTFELLLDEKIHRENSAKNCEIEKKFIDFLLDKKNGFTAEEIRDHVKATTFAVSFKSINCEISTIITFRATTHQQPSSPQLY